MQVYMKISAYGLTNKENKLKTETNLIVFNYLK